MTQSEPLAATQSESQVVTQPRSIVVLDYGSGNLHSATRALIEAGKLAQCSVSVTLSADPELAVAADGLVVPGVGAFAACMAGLTRVGAAEIIKTRIDNNRPVLGICVGHQVMFSFGEEHCESSRTQIPGLGFWPGVVRRLRAKPLPHMGWNKVSVAGNSKLFTGIESQRFYFVHSYAASVPESDFPNDVNLTWCHYGTDKFLAAVESGPLCATQFHPEKSGAAGLRLLANWITSSC